MFENFQQIRVQGRQILLFTRSPCPAYYRSVVASIRIQVITFRAVMSISLALFVQGMGSSGLAAEPSSPDDATGPSAPRFISPDGKFGLIVTRGTAGESDEDRVELIEVATKRSLVVLSDPERPERADKARLDWSADSKRVAAFTGTRVDGFTRIFVREGMALWK